jgi:hypothetical protein
MYLGLLLEVDLQSFSNFSARKKCVVGVTSRPLYPEKGPLLLPGCVATSIIAYVGI